MSDLETLLNQNEAPAARSDLASRILAAAETAEAANDTRASRSWWSMGGVAAMAIMAAIFMLQPNPEPETQWEQIADSSGFTELYEWVEGEEG